MENQDMLLNMPEPESGKTEKEKKEIKQKALRIGLRVFTYLIMSVGAFILVFPYLWMILSSFKGADEAALEFTFFPRSWSTEAYTQLFTDPNFPIFRGLLNTIIIEVSVIFIGTFVSAMAAFSFAKLKLRFKTFWLLFLMSGMMVPYAALMLPQYRAFEALGMTDTLWPLILPGFFGNVSMIFFLTQYMRGIPNAYFEAARIDGANHFKCFVVIMFPLVYTAIAAQVIFWFVGIWNDYFAPSIYLSSPETKTLQVLLGGLNEQGSGVYLPMSLAGSFLASIPMLVIYITCQKFFIESLAISGVKG